MDWKHSGRNVLCAGWIVVALSSLTSAQAQEGRTWPIEDMQRQWIRWGNGLRTDHLVFNALSTNPTANELLTQMPLNTHSFEDEDELNLALHDPAARHFMKYLVSCALGPRQEVSWTPHSMQGGSQVWHGGGGLCEDWHDNPPTPECLERVSACILARNNPAGVRVRISLRGGGENPPATLLPREITSPDTFTPAQSVNRVLRPAEPILSFSPCDSASQTDCGWQPLVVGQCEPSAQVKITVQGSTAVCGSLRVCQKAQGCVNGDADMIEESSTSCGSSGVDFTCPGTGIFSVLSLITASSSNKGQTESWRFVSMDTAGPLSEQALFPVREGAFYGNLFGSGAILPGLSVTFDPNLQETQLRLPGSELVYVRQDESWCKRGSNEPSGPCLAAMPVVGSGQSIYQRLYACTAPEWEGDSENLPGRVCALPKGSANCAAHLMGSCLPGATPGVCQEAGDGNFGECEGTEPEPWRNSITTFMSMAR